MTCTGEAVSKFLKYGNLRSEPEPLSPEEKGVTETYISLVEIEGNLIRAYIKDISLRGIINELVGSCLGLSLGLPMAIPVLVKNDEYLFSPKNNVLVGGSSILFGSIAFDNPPISLFLPTGLPIPLSLASFMKKWNKLHKTIAFDELIAMTDRHERNILFENGDIVLIDHADAFSGEYWSEVSLKKECNFGNHLLNGFLGGSIEEKDLKELNLEAKTLEELFLGVDCIKLYEQCLLYKMDNDIDCQAFESFISYRGANLTTILEKAAGA